MWQLGIHRDDVDGDGINLSIGEIHDLIYYEETQIDAGSEPLYTRMKRIMHSYVPPNAFKATVRVRGCHDANSDVLSTYGTDYTDEDTFIDADSPVSFPTTPFSRARVMNR